MNTAAIALSRIAIWIGFPQVLIGMLGLFEGGWTFVVALGLILMPFVPMIVRMHPRTRGRAAPAVVASARISHTPRGLRCAFGEAAAASVRRKRIRTYG